MERQRYIVIPNRFSKIAIDCLNSGSASAYLPRFISTRLYWQDFGNGRMVCSEVFFIDRLSPLQERFGFHIFALTFVEHRQTVERICDLWMFRS